MKKNLQPHIMCGEGDVARYVLMPGDPGRVLRIGEKLDDYREVAFNREFRIITGSYKGVPVTVCSTGIGGPSTAIAVEELAKVGAETIIRVGSCGGCQPGIKIGDLIISEGVVKSDGTSKMYIPDSYPAVPDPEAFRALTSAARKLGFRYHTGISISTDTFYLKMQDFVEYWRERGIIAWDMEAGTFLTVGRLKNLRAGVVLAVVNELAELMEPWKGVRRYAVQALKRRKGREISGEQRAILVALDAIRYLEGNAQRSS